MGYFGCFVDLFDLCVDDFDCGGDVVGGVEYVIECV